MLLVVPASPVCSEHATSPGSPILVRIEGSPRRPGCGRLPAAARPAVPAGVVLRAASAMAAVASAGDPESDAPAQGAGEENIRVTLEELADGAITLTFPGDGANFIQFEPTMLNSDTGVALGAKVLAVVPWSAEAESLSDHPLWRLEEGMELLSMNGVTSRDMDFRDILQMSRNAMDGGLPRPLVLTLRRPDAGADADALENRRSLQFFRSGTMSKLSKSVSSAAAAALAAAPSAADGDADAAPSSPSKGTVSSFINRAAGRIQRRLSHAQTEDMAKAARLAAAAEHQRALRELSPLLGDLRVEAIGGGEALVLQSSDGRRVGDASDAAFLNIEWRVDGSAAVRTGGALQPTADDIGRSLSATARLLPLPEGDLEELRASSAADADAPAAPLALSGAAALAEVPQSPSLRAACEDARYAMASCSGGPCRWTRALLLRCDAEAPVALCLAGGALDVHAAPDGGDGDGAPWLLEGSPAGERLASLPLEALGVHCDPFRPRGLALSLRAEDGALSFAPLLCASPLERDALAVALRLRRSSAASEGAAPPFVDGVPLASPEDLSAAPFAAAGASEPSGAADSPSGAADFPSGAAGSPSAAADFPSDVPWIAALGAHAASAGGGASPAGSLALREALSALEAEASLRRAELSSCAEERDALRRRLRRVGAELSAAEESAAELMARLAEAEGLRGAEERLLAAERALEEERTALRAAQRDKVRLAAELASAREAAGGLDVALRERDEAVAERRGLRLEIEGLAGQKRALGEERKALEERAKAADAALEAARAEAAEARREAAASEARAEAEAQGREALLLERNGLRRRAESLARELSSVKRAVGSVAECEERKRSIEELRGRVAVEIAERRRAEDDAEAARGALEALRAEREAERRRRSLPGAKAREMAASASLFVRRRMQGAEDAGEEGESAEVERLAGDVADREAELKIQRDMNRRLYRRVQLLLERCSEEDVSVEDIVGDQDPSDVDVTAV